MIRLRLNPKKVGNYAFFCPVSRLHLTLSNPVGLADRVTQYILRGVKTKSLIDIDNVIDLNTGTVKAVAGEGVGGKPASTGAASQDTKKKKKESKAKEKEKPVSETPKVELVEEVKKKEAVKETLEENSEAAKEDPVVDSVVEKKAKKETTKKKTTKKAAETDTK